MEAFDSIPSAILQSLAWIFTALAGVVSIALTIMKFGLSPMKRVFLIVGTVVFGLIVVLVLVPFAYDKDAAEQPTSGGGGAPIAGLDSDFLKTLIESGTVSGMMIRDDGSMELVFATDTKQRSSKDLVAVDLPEESRQKGGVQTVLATSGTAVQAEVGNETLDVSVDDNNVIVALGDQAEFLDRKNLKESKSFAVANVEESE